MTKEELYEQLEELISSVAKFKTHKNRKTFFGELKQKIEFFLNNPERPQRYTDAGITRPNPNGRGENFRVMTESMSGMGDKVREETIAKKNQ